MILHVILGVLAGVLLVATVAQWAFNVSLYANPYVWIIAAIIALIAIIVILVLWIIDLWKNNLDFKYGIIKIWNDIINFFDRVGLFFTQFGAWFANFFDGLGAGILKIVEDIVNGVIDLINFLIAQANKIPGIAIDPIQKVGFGTQAQLEAEARAQIRNNNVARMEQQVAAKAAEREAKRLADRATEEAALAESERKAREEQEKNEEQTKAQEDPGFNWDEFKVGGGKIDEIGKINSDVSITDEDLKLLKDVAKTEFINRYTTLRPELTVSFGDVHETADVNALAEKIVEMTEQAYAESLIN